MGGERELVLNVLKVFGLAAFAFVVAMGWTPVLTNFLYKHRLWRKKARTHSPDGTATPIFNLMHKEKEVSVPRLGGLLIWGTTLGITLGLWLLTHFTDIPLLEKMNFLSRNQTWLPLFTLVAASLLGLADDILQIYERGGYIAGGVPYRIRLVLVILIGVAGGWWFHYKLGFSALYVPFFGDIPIDGLYIPLFVLVMVAMFSSSVIDGLDGLAGGVFASIFAAFGGIAFFQNQIDLAAFSAVMLGALLAFLWFNIPPARFYMGETGSLGLVAVITVLAFLTNSVIVLPIIGLLLVVESASVILQFASKKFRGKKLFLVAPIHHHFEAGGWPAYKVTMRFWVVSVVFAIIGMVVALVGR